MIKLTSVASILFGIAWLVPSRADELADPRTANLWGCWRFLSGGMEHASRIDLWLGVHFSMAGGKIVSSKTLDQTRNGDEWHTLVERLKLEPGEQPVVRIRNAGGSLLIADALHVFSTERYSDGKGP